MCCVCLPRTLSKFALRPGEVCVCVCCVCAVYVLCVGLFPEYQPRIQARNRRGRKVNIQLS